jgi:hypothetical protein
LIEFVASAAELGVWSREAGQSCGHARPENPGVGSREELTGPQAEVGQAVAMGVGDTLDHSVETQATEVIRHPSLCEVRREEASKFRRRVCQRRSSSNAWIHENFPATVKVP